MSEIAFIRNSKSFSSSIDGKGQFSFLEHVRCNQNSYRMTTECEQQFHRSKEMLLRCAMYVYSVHCYTLTHIDDTASKVSIDIRKLKQNNAHAQTHRHTHTQWRTYGRASEITFEFLVLNSQFRFRQCFHMVATAKMLYG